MAENTLFPNISVRELRAGIPQIRGVPTSVSAVVIRSLRGPVDTPVRIDSTSKGRRIFGNYDPNSFAMEGLDGYFLNKGSAVYITRAQPTGGSGANTKASKTIQSAAGGATSATKVMASGPYNLEPGQTVIVDVDNGGGATATFDAAAAQVTGSGFAIVSLNGDTLVLEIDDDGDDQTITFTAGAVSLTTVIAEINDQLRKGKAEASGGQVRIKSDKRGTGSHVQIKSGSALGELGLSVTTANGTGDVADIDAVTEAEMKTVIEADTAATVDITGAAPVMSSPTTGVASELDYTGGTALTAFGLSVQTINGTASSSAQDAVKFEALGPGEDYDSIKVLVAAEDSTIGIANATLATAISAGAVASITVTAALRAKLAVGDTVLLTDSGNSNTLRAVISKISGNVITFEDSQTAAVGGLAIATTSMVLETWRFSLVEEGRTTWGPVRGLRMSPLSTKNYFATRINADDPECPITVTDMGAEVGSNGSDNRPVNVSSSGDSLAGGATMTTYQDLDYIGVSASKTGLYSFDKKKDIRMVAIPGVTGTVTGAVSKGLLDYCTNREDCIAVLSTAQNVTPEDAVTYKNTYLGASSFAVMYYPWLKIVAPLTGQKASTPPELFVMGCIARTDQTRGVAKAPAGEVDGRILGVLGVERELSDDDKSILYPAGINPIEAIEGVSVASIMGSRTMEHGDFEQINARRTFIYLRLSLKEGLRFVLFEANNTATRAKARRVAASFLSTEWKKGTLDGDTLDEAFWIICDKSNNPPSLIKIGGFGMDVGANIPSTIETPVINLQQDQRALLAELGIAA